MTRYTNLDAVQNHVWEEIEAAADTPEHAFRRLTFGTVHDRAPDLRTVVLREANAEDHVLQFHTDRRSRKVEALRENERVAWHGWNPEAREQIRMQATATVHLDDNVAMDLWASQPPDSLAVYVRPSAPGSTLDDPDDALRPDANTEPTSKDDVAAGRQNFAVIRTVIDRIEWLHLHPDGHYRARFTYRPERGDVDATWVAP